MTVYLEKNDSIEKKESLSEYINKDSIDVVKLRELLEKDYYTVYSTSPESGTYKAYLKTVGNDKKYKLDSTKYYSCESDSDLFEQTKKPYMILGGKYYYPKNFAEHIKRDDIHVLTLYEKKAPVSNSLYLYFMAYNDGNKYKVSKEILDLLTILGFKDEDNKFPDKDENFYYYYKKDSKNLVQPINKKD